MISIKFNNNMKEYILFDYTKLFASFFIIGIHTQLFVTQYEYISFMLGSISRMTLPLFATISGFLYQKFRYKENQTKKYLNRLFVPFVFWNTIYIFLRIIIMVQEQKSIALIVGKSVQSIFFYPQGAMWFALAIIYSIIIIEYVIRNDKSSLVLAVVLYGWSLMCGTYYEIFPMFIKRVIDIYSTVCGTGNNNVTSIFIFVILGMQISKINTEYLYRKRKKLVSLFLLGIVLVFAEMNIVYVIQGKYVPYYITGILIYPIIVSIISICSIDKRGGGINNELARKLSTGIYFSHCLFTYTLEILCNVVDIELTGNSKFCIITVFTLCFCFFCFKIDNKFVRQIVT